MTTWLRLVRFINHSYVKIMKKFWPQISLKYSCSEVWVSQLCSWSSLWSMFSNSLPQSKRPCYDSIQQEVSKESTSFVWLVARWIYLHVWLTQHTSFTMQSEFFLWSLIPVCTKAVRRRHPLVVMTPWVRKPASIIVVKAVSSKTSRGHEIL